MYKGVNRVGIDVSKGHYCVPKKASKGHAWQSMGLKSGKVGTTVYCEGYEVARAYTTPYTGHLHHCRKRCGGGANRWGAHENAKSYREDTIKVYVNGNPMSRKEDPIKCPAPTTGTDKVKTGSTKIFSS